MNAHLPAYAFSASACGGLTLELAGAELTLRASGALHLAAAATILTGEDGRPEGAVLVLDDVTPLIRAQRVAAWRDVARRLAHEIKNPLTPIQLSAERLRRHFGSAPEPTLALVNECTGAIITEVEALKGLVDEFAQFARLRGPRLVPSDLNRLVEETLQLYSGVLQRGSLRLERQAGALPPVRLDAEQIRQVIINLVDNAVEALGGPSASVRPWPRASPPCGSSPSNRLGARASTIDSATGRPKRSVTRPKMAPPACISIEASAATPEATSSGSLQEVA